MIHLDIETFMVKGQLFGFNKETTETEVTERLGKGFEVEDYGKNGKYLHYENLRFSFSQERLTGMDVFLINSDKTYECNTPDGIVMINKTTSLLKMLSALNSLGLKWEIPYAKSKLDYLLIEISSGLKIFYYFEKEVLDSMGMYW